MYYITCDFNCDLIFSTIKQLHISYFMFRYVILCIVFYVRLIVYEFLTEFRKPVNKISLNS